MFVCTVLQSSFVPQWSLRTRAVAICMKGRLQHVHICKSFSKRWLMPPIDAQQFSWPQSIQLIAETKSVNGWDRFQSFESTASPTWKPIPVIADSTDGRSSLPFRTGAAAATISATVERSSAKYLNIKSWRHVVVNTKSISHRRYRWFMIIIANRRRSFATSVSESVSAIIERPILPTSSVYMLPTHHRHRIEWLIRSAVSTAMHSVIIPTGLNVVLSSS